MINRFTNFGISLLSALTFLMAAGFANAAVYNVGPGQDHEDLNSVPWRSLTAGDEVVIQWRSEPYRSKIGLRGQGTASQPIVIRGVSGPGGAKPEITGDNAQTPSDLVGFFNTRWDELLGTIIIKRASSDPWGYKPKHITFENLRITGGHPDYQYRSQDGSTQNYGRGAAGLWAILVENLIVKDCEFVDNANGLFVLSKNNDEADTSRNILVQSNLFRENGISGSYLEHNLYLQVAGVTYEHNRIERLRNGALGASLKDRSSGAVVRYNWIEASTRALDLVGPEDSYEILMNESDYEDAYVYGNYFHYDADRVSAENNGIITAHFIHWGGDSGNTARYRMGTLYFFSNTFVVKSMKSTRWHMSIFDLSNSDQSVHIANNIMHLEGDTEFYILRQAGGTA
ncbi:MAG: hypothetical protein MI867_10085, partial [Pseudomonadales bacterium]|nr:hypothetical protein [Pseudomonadales bacterium]